MQHKGDILQVLLGCDRPIRRVANQPAIQSIIDQSVLLVKRVMAKDYYGHRVVMYDVESDEWQRIGGEFPMHFYGSPVTARIDEESLYIVYSDAHSSNSAIIHPYNILNNETPTHTPVSLTGAGMTISEYFHLIPFKGGILRVRISSSNPTSNISVLNPATKEWRVIANQNKSMPGSRAIALPSGDILICGGDDHGASPLCYIYIVDRNVYRQVTGLNVPRRNHAICLLPNGNVFVHGGEVVAAPGGGDMPTSTCEEYDAEKDEWRLMPFSSPYLFSHEAIAVGNGRILLFAYAASRVCLRFDYNTMRFRMIRGFTGEGASDKSLFIPLVK